MRFNLYLARDGGFWVVMNKQNLHSWNVSFSSRDEAYKFMLDIVKDEINE